MSFHIEDNSTESTLKAAILLYGSSNGVTSFATIHPVTTDGDNPPVIGAGSPMDEGVLKRLATELASTLNIKSGILPSNVLSVSGDHIMWWSPPSRKTYFFTTRKSEGTAWIGNRHGQAFTPGLVFLVKGSSMRLFAVKGNERPKDSTPLFHAPLMNVYADGRLCTGSMAIPKTSMADSIAEWEKSFWESSFSHPNNSRAVNYKGGLHAFSIDLLDGKFRKFPERFLRPMKLTLQAVVDELDDEEQGRGRG